MSLLQLAVLWPQETNIFRLTEKFTLFPEEMKKYDSRAHKNALK